MESLIKQTRARFAGSGQVNREESSSTSDRKIPPQKTPSFREKKRSQSWIKRQFSRQMSSDYDFSSTDYPAAVAAAALAIQALEESKTQDQRKLTFGPDKSLTRTKSKKEDAAVDLSEPPRKSSLKSSDTKAPVMPTSNRKIPEKGVEPAQSRRKISFSDDGELKPTRRKVSFSDDTELNATRRKISFADDTELDTTKRKISFADDTELNTTKRETSFADDNEVTTKKAAEPGPPIETPPSLLTDRQLNITGGGKPEPPPKPDRPLNTQSVAPPVEMKRPIRSKTGPRESKADAWEKAEMTKIKERYEKVNIKIQNWETKKKKKARQKLEATEAELDKRRAKAMQKYRSKISRIEEIAQGATAQAVDNRRNEELKVREKAKRIRATGELPATCLCF